MEVNCFAENIDLKTAVVAKRETVTLMEEWETMGNVNLEM